MIRVLTSVALASLLALSIPAQKRRPAQKPQTPAAEEKKPSLKETLDFLKEKIVANAFYKYSSGPDPGGELVTTYRVEDVQFDGCALTLKTVNTKVFSADPIVDTTTFVEKVEMTDLDPKRLVVQDNGSNFAVALNTIDDRKTIHYHWDEKGHNMFTGMPRNSVDDGSSSAVGIRFTDKDMANRVAKAFVYAIGLCAGKKEPF